MSKQREGTCQNCGNVGFIREYDLCNSCYSKYLVWKNKNPYNRELRRIACINYYNRQKDNPKWREASNAKRRARYTRRMKDPEKRAEYNKKAVKKYHRLMKDPEKRKRCNELHKLRYHKRKKEEPEFAERQRQYTRKRREREREVKFWEMTEKEIGFKLTLGNSFGF